MSGHGKEVLDGLREPVHALRGVIGPVFDGYGAMGTAALADGALDAKTKELIALAISVSKQCDGCIATHARGAARRGASNQEVGEAIGVAIMMNGGPATVHGARAYDAYQEFAAGL